MQLDSVTVAMFNRIWRVGDGKPPWCLLSAGSVGDSLSLEKLNTFAKSVCARVCVRARMRLCGTKAVSPVSDCLFLKE